MGTTGNVEARPPRSRVGSGGQPAWVGVYLCETVTLPPTTMTIHRKYQLDGVGVGTGESPPEGGRCVEAVPCMRASRGYAPSSWSVSTSSDWRDLAIASARAQRPARETTTRTAGVLAGVARAARSAGLSHRPGGWRRSAGALISNSHGRKRGRSRRRRGTRIWAASEIAVLFASARPVWATRGAAAIMAVAARAASGQGITCKSIECRS